MRPEFTSDNFCHVSSWQTKRASYSALIAVALCEFKHCCHLILGIFCHAVLRAKSVTIFGDHVAVVIGAVTFKEMIPANATDRTTIAMMQSTRVRPSPMCNEKTEVVGGDTLALKPEGSTASMFGAGGPNMASPKLWSMFRNGPVLVDLGKESCERFFIHELVPRGSAPGRVRAARGHLTSSMGAA